jgi:HK97 family phage major capsid protein
LRNSVTPSSGAGAIATDVLTQDFIELLTAETLLNKLGANFIPGLIGNVALPKTTSGASTEWFDPTAITDPTQSTAPIGSVPMNMGGIRSQIPVPQSFLKQGSIDCEGYLRKLLAKEIAISIDVAGFQGTGSNNQPLGVQKNTSVPVVALGATGGALTFAKAVAQESALASSNALRGKLAYVTTPGVVGAAKTTPKVSGYPVFLVEDGELNGYPIYGTTSMPSNWTKSTATDLHGMTLGNWSDLNVGIWGDGVEFIVDPYKYPGSLCVTAILNAQIALSHVESFCNISDISVA